MKVKFDCGCEFDSDDGRNILLPTDIESIPLDCVKTYDLISKGLVKGVFQIEGKAGQRFSSKLRPENMEQISALISIIRPGTADSKDLTTGKTLAEVFCERKNGTLPIEVIDPTVEDILWDTFQVVCYQEQIMRIAATVAGFNAEQNSKLRKAFSKKLADVMSQVRVEFYEGVARLGIISKEKGEELWGIIESSQKYSFNKSILDTTLVLTKNGEKEIKDLEINEEILCPVNDNIEYCKVKNKYNHGIQEVYKITLENGNSISCTLEHKFLCENNEILPLRDILLQKLRIACI